MEAKYQEKLDKLIIKHKKKIAGAGLDLKEIIPQEELTKKMTAIKNQAKEISLVVAEFKCQKCSSEKELQLHHLIMRKAKDFIDFNRYITQRYYWANIIVLCPRCHCNYHGFNKMGKDYEELSISKDYIAKLCKKYGFKSNSMNREKIKKEVK